MPKSIFSAYGGVTLIGGGPVSAKQLRMAMEIAPDLVAADSGADRALALGVMPRMVLGDLDSLSDASRAALGAARLHRISEQVTTDFDKALRSISAPFVLGLGFLGGRIDHELAAFTSLIGSAQRCILIGTRDLVFHLPSRIALDLRRGDRVSLYPLRAVQAESEGLEWPLQGLDFAPDAMIGTSNRARGAKVVIRTHGSGMLCILPRARLKSVVAALQG